MNLILTNGRVKKNGESLKELWEIVNGLKGQPVGESLPIQIPSGSNIDIGQLQSLFASKDALANLEKRV